MTDRELPMDVNRPPAAAREPYPGDPAGHFPPLDGLRGLAVLMIVLHHNFHLRDPGSALLGLIRSASETTWVGVNLFFVLSGFLIGGILIDSRGTPDYFRTFYARRALRIFPLYYAFLLFFFLVVTPLSDRLGMPVARVANKWPMFLYYTNMVESRGPSPGSLAPIWSLAVEEQVYLIWPALVALLAPRRLLVVMLALLPACLAWRVGALAAHRSIMWAYAWTPACLDAFAAGTIGAILVRGGHDGATLRRWALLAVAGSGLFIAGMAIGLEDFFFWHYPKAVLTAGLTALCVLFGGTILYLVTSPPDAPVNRFFSQGWLRSAGRYSYAMYLFHLPVANLVRALTGSRYEGGSGFRSLVQQGGFFLVTLVLTYLLAVASWNVLEKPFLRLKKYFPTRGRGVPGLVADVRREGPAPAEDAAAPAYAS